MGSLLSNTNNRPISPITSAIRIYTLPALLLFSFTLSSNDIEELSVTVSDGVYSLKATSVLDVPADYVYYIITDYLHAYRINPSITEIEILPSINADVTRLRNHSEHCIGPFCFDINWTGTIVEPEHGHIVIDTIPELGSFESGSAIWRIRPNGERTWLHHESTLKPDFFIPPLIGDKVMKSKMASDTVATFNRIECYAKIVLEMEMEHEPELIRALVTKGNNCNQSQENALSMRDQ